MGKKVELSIPEPCLANWDQMSEDETGKYCQSCHKTVIDFSRMSDAQIASFFNKSKKDKVCGHFYQDQLNKPIHVSVPQPKWYSYLMKLLLPAFFFTTRAASQSAREKPATFVSPQKTLRGDTIIIDPEITVNGNVSDKDGFPIAGATIMIKGTSIGTAADANGNFSIRVPVSKKGSVLVISSIGFKSVEKQIETNGPRSIQIFVQPLDVQVMGEIVVYHKKEKKSKKTHKVDESTRTTVDSTKKTPLHPMSFKVFPNPVKSGSSLNLVCSRLKPDYYRIQILNHSGQEVMNTKSWIDGDEQVLNVAMPVVSVGSYIVVISRGEEKFTEKLVIN